jgi:hypothetical protein
MHHRVAHVADGRRLALGVSDTIDYVLVYDLARRETYKLAGPHALRHPILNPDGSLVAFRAGALTPDLYVQDAEGREPPRAFAELRPAAGLDDWSPDGRVIAVRNLGFVSLATQRIDYPGDERWGWGSQFSPSGRWFAYTRTRGSYTVWIRPYPEPRAPTGCRSIPRWEKPRLAFETDYVDTAGKSNEVSPTANGFTSSSLRRR